MPIVRSQDGTTIAFDKTGHGHALVFITGAICHRNFAPVLKDAKVLSQGFTVYSYDRRGRGDSTDTQPYDVDRELEDLEALIDHVGASVTLYGHSSGAVLALHAAARFPQKVSRVAVFDPPYAVNESDKPANDQTLKTIEDLIGREKFAAALRHFLVTIGMPKLFIFLLPLFPGWSQMKKLAPTLRYDLRITNRLPPAEILSQVKQPALLMNGAKNKYDFKRVIEKIATFIPSANVVRVEGQDHMVKPETILENLRAW